MTFISLLLILIIIGVIIWAVTTYIPLPPAFKNLILIVGVIIAVIYVLNAFGIINGVMNVQVPSVK